MKAMRFHEYMNSKGKIESPVVKLDGDRLETNKPPVAPPGGGKPYMAKNGKSKKSDKGFGDQGDESLKYNPKVDNDSKGKSPAKLPTVDEVAIVAQMVSAVQEDPSLIETVVRQLKAKGLLGALVAEMLNHNETYNQISEVMSHSTYGPDLCTKLVRAMNEEVAKPFSDQLDVDDEDDSDEEGDLDDDLEDGDDLDAELGLDGDEDLGLDDDGEFDDSMEDPSMGQDPSMDPNMAMDPMMGQDPTMGGQMMDPNMMAQMANHPAMANFQRAMMKAFMRKMMRKI